MRTFMTRQRITFTLGTHPDILERSFGMEWLFMGRDFGTRVGRTTFGGAARGRGALVGSTDTWAGAFTGRRFIRQAGIGTVGATGDPIIPTGVRDCSITVPSCEGRD